jgi:two-component system response regulator (stage 0 sporulation protein F)
MSINEWVEEFLAKPSRLLVVDDQDGIAELIERALDGYHCEITSVGDGKEAVQELRDGKFDLVFLDIVLPGLNGIEVLRELKRITPETPVVIMTGYFNNLLLDEASRLGIVSFIRKPIDFTPDFVRQIYKLFKLRGGPTQSIFSDAHGELTTA